MLSAATISSSPRAIRHGPGGHQPLGPPSVTPDLSKTLLTWKQRLPDRSQGLSRWDAILRWRLTVFDSVLRMCQLHHNSDNPNAANIHNLQDSAWTVLSLVRVARRQHLLDVSTKSSAPLQNMKLMEINDSFTRLREQILLSLSTKVLAYLDIPYPPHFLSSSISSFFTFFFLLLLTTCHDDTSTHYLPSFFLSLFPSPPFPCSPSSAPLPCSSSPSPLSLVHPRVLTS